MQPKYQIVPGAMAALVLGSAGTTALAQNQSASLEEIVVTASKRESGLQDTSVAVTAITSEAIDRLAIQEVNDYLEVVPGMTALQRTAETYGPRTVGLRGVQSLNNTFSIGQNTVGFYIDEAVVPFSNPRLVDLERIEVLRGPQGTLYGSATLAGTIKLVTMKPDFDSVSGRILADVNTMDDGGTGYTLDGAINIPLSDNFAFRVSGYTDTTPGFVDYVEADLPTVTTGVTVKDANETTSYGGRIIAKWQATDDLALTFSYMYNNSEVDNTSVFSRPTTDGLPVTQCAFWVANQPECPDPTVAVSEFTGDPNSRDDPKTLGRGRSPADAEFGLTSFTIDWALSSADLVSNTSFYSNESNISTELTEFLGASFGRDIFVDDGLGGFALQPRPVFFYRNLQMDEFTHETRLVSSWDKAFNYTVGIFYTDRDEDLVTGAALGEGSYLLFPFPPFFFPNLSDDGSAFATVGNRGRKETSIFGELTYDFSEQFSATIGGRFYDHEFNLSDVFTGNPVWIGDPSGMSTQSSQATADGTLFSFKASFRPSDDTLLYANVAEGFRMGGGIFAVPEEVPSCQAQLIALFGQPTAPTKYEPDDLVNYELGWKQTWNNGRATTNAAVFFIDWDNTQTTIPGVVCGIGGFPVNAGAVESKGVEFETQTLLGENLLVGFHLAYIDSEIKEALQISDAAPAIAVPGDRLPSVPEWSGSLNWDWGMDFSSNVRGYFRGLLTYRDETVVGIGNNDNLTDAYTLLDLRFGALVNDSWDLSVYIENALDERPSLFGSQPEAVDPEPTGFRYAETTLLPRSYGLMISKHFN